MPVVIASGVKMIVELDQTSALEYFALPLTMSVSPGARYLDSTATTMSALSEPS